MKQDHLKDHSMGYWEHCKHALEINNKLIPMVLKSTVHAFFPNAYADDGPIEVYNIYHEIKELPNVRKLYEQLDNERVRQ
tara:strand:+ start:267 stop:506 length:240 start_codon:yes stop_codon:yes gene_type:complete